MNPAYEVGRNTANTLGSAFKRVNDENAIESILSQAMQSGNPEEMQNSIGKILSQVSPERQGAAIKYLENTFKNLQSKQEKAQSKAALLEEGVNPNLPEALQKTQYEHQLQQQQFKNITGGQPFGSPTGQPGEQGVPQQQVNGQSRMPQQMQSQQSPQQSQQPMQNPKQGLAALSEDQLIALTGMKAYAEPAKAEMKRREEEKKIEADRIKQDRKEEMEFHKESATYYDRILDEGEKAGRQIQSLSDIEQDIRAGKVKPTSFANVFKGAGTIGDKISEALLSGEEAKIGAILPYLLEGWKQVFGVRLSDADLRVLQDKLPSIGKSPEANLAVIKIMQKYGKQTQLRAKIARDIETNNGGIRPSGFRNKVEDAFQQSVQMVPIIRPKKNPTDPDVIINIPLFELPAAIQSGGKVAG